MCWDRRLQDVIGWQSETERGRQYAELFSDLDRDLVNFCGRCHAVDKGFRAPAHTYDAAVKSWVGTAIAVGFLYNRVFCVANGDEKRFSGWNVAIPDDSIRDKGITQEPNRSGLPRAAVPILKERMNGGGY